jgi:hypothetical protein
MNILLDASASLRPIPAKRKKFIILRFCVTDVRNDSQIDGLRLQTLGCGGTTDASTVLAACMFCNDALSPHGTERMELPYTVSESLEVLPVQLCSSLRLSHTASSADFSVRQALVLGLFECCLFNQQALPLVTFTGANPP